ncbi:glycosyl transferase family 2 [Arachidicoccus ginsenosidimutans]|uniref:glycosyltransferase n=1 Tax=Arachidicoccus sp. BS20 TaxID=1850526 RepID=UPI0007F09E1E|nr:glycosyltransferase [Arachidicoccus sp. BS20]ANI89954.1 glycosyl transferase family 2 [Arachidicoccus sp. BS20]
MKIPPFSLGFIFFAAFCLVIFIQLCYYLFVFGKLAFYKPKQKSSSQEYPVSVIVCGKDEAENIATHLPAALVQNYTTTHEIVFVDDNSTDETKYLLEGLGRQFKGLRTLLLTQDAMGIPGKKFPLSMGIRAAKYETLLLTDADCFPASENWIKLMQDGYDEGISIVLGYGAYAKKKGVLNKLIRFETFHTALQYLSFALVKMPYMGVGRNLSYKREMFLKNKGFASINHIPGGDDDLFIIKIANETNTAIVIDKDAHTISEPKATWREWQKQKRRHYSTSKYYPAKFKWWLGLYSFSHFLVYPLLAVSIIFFNWWLPLSVYFLRLIVLAVIWKKTMNKLNESDLWSRFLLFDIWMFLYYFIMSPNIFRRAERKWK